MEADSPEVEKDDTESGFTVPASLALSLDIKTARMDMYVVTSDRLDNLEGASGSWESTIFGASLAVFLTVGGILVSTKWDAIGQKLTIVLWGLLIGSFFPSIFFGVEVYNVRKASRQRFNDIRTKSKTVVTLASKQ